MYFNPGRLQAPFQNEMVKGPTLALRREGVASYWKLYVLINAIFPRPSLCNLSHLCQLIKYDKKIKHTVCAVLGIRIFNISFHKKTMHIFIG